MTLNNQSVILQKVIKGEIMPTKTDEKITQLTQTVNKLKVRVTQLVDELANTRNELSKFKSDVASDVKYLTNRVDG